MMTGALEHLKQRIPLLDYLQQRNWTARRVGAHPEFVGLCPLHPETRPSFYVNADKNLFYCHGCGRGGDLIRLVQLSRNLSFRQSVAYLQQQLSPPVDSDVLEKAAAFYQFQLHRHPEAVQYLQKRGLCDPALIEELGIGYAPGGILRSHLADHGYSFDQLLESGLITPQGRDTFCRRVIFPLRRQGAIVNLYGRSMFVCLKGRLRGRPMTVAGLRSLFRHHRLASRTPLANAHRFRHTFGADMARAGICLPALQHLMGHAQIRTTMLYIQLAPQDVWREYARAAGKRTKWDSSQL
jgi:hypothetical protein